MTTSGDKQDQGQPATPTQPGLVYVAPGGSPAAYDADRLSLGELWDRLWRGKLVIITTTIIFAAASVTYALLATEIYRAEVLLAPAEEQGTPLLGGQLGGLAALAGVSAGGGSEAEPLAALRSRDFARAFIEDLDLLPLFFADDWDAAAESWRVANPADAPDVRDGIQYFQQNVLAVSEERATGLVTIAVEWTDPDVAANWANLLVKRLNDRLRERALEEAQTNVTYLQQEMAKSSLVTMQASIGQLLQTELQKLMLARGNEEFAFKVVDPAMSPRYRARPRRAMVAVIGTVLGGLFGALVVLLTGAGRGVEAA